VVVDEYDVVLTEVVVDAVVVLWYPPPQAQHMAAGLKSESS
jgi:hypothetical protein